MKQFPDNMPARDLLEPADKNQEEVENASYNPMEIARYRYKGTTLIRE
jgi:hypothetical protein